MSAIYQPRGKAREYSPLALNLYKGCSHACTYCFAPSATFTDRARFSCPSYIRSRPGILEQLAKEAGKLAKDHREILMCFTSDPYQPCEESYCLTRQALEILKKHALVPTVLTKGGKLAQRDFDLLSSTPGSAFAVTLTCKEDRDSLAWEPGAALPCERINNLREAKKAGIRTWVSFEPVLYPQDVITLIEETHNFVDLYKIGKLNYHTHSKSIDWVGFRDTVKSFLSRIGKPYIIKKDLLAAK